MDEFFRRFIATVKTLGAQEGQDGSVTQREKNKQSRTKKERVKKTVFDQGNAI